MGIIKPLPPPAVYRLPQNSARSHFAILPSAFQVFGWVKTKMPISTANTRKVGEDADPLMPEELTKAIRDTHVTPN
jgi:hypothetical protein